MNPQKKLYFKNLDGLRFIAASMVLVSHCYFFSFSTETIKQTFLGEFFTFSGIYGVKLFFVLSGFLITYLLLNEQAKNGKINIKNFYIRRTLRIWPLYFLVGIGGTIAGPIALSKLGIAAESGFTLENLLYVFCFGINIQLIFDTFNRGIVEILWSVCVEEQFYLLWCPLVVFFRKHLMPMFIFITFIGILTPFYFNYFGNSSWSQASYFFTTSAFSMFGLGGILAYLLQRGILKSSSFIYQKWFQLLVLGLCVALSFNLFSWLNTWSFYKLNLSNIACGVLFGLLIIQLIHQKSIFNLENSLLKEGGKISYGIYVYHTFVAQVIIRILPKLGIAKTHFLYEFVCVFLVLILSVGISYASYYLFENHFLKLKKRFV